MKCPTISLRRSRCCHVTVLITVVATNVLTQATRAVVACRGAHATETAAAVFRFCAT